MKPNQKKRLTKAYANEKGYTLIIAIVIMVVLLIVGTAVITVAANSLNTVNRRVESRQTYYVAKSAMNVIDRSILNGELGKSIKEKAFAALLGTTGTSKHKLTIRQVDLQGMEGCSVEDMEISYEGHVSPLITGDGAVSNSVELSNVTVSFTAVYAEQKYKIKATYTYNGMAKQDSLSGKVEWSGDTWINTSVSQ